MKLAFYRLSSCSGSFLPFLITLKLVICIFGPTVTADPGSDNCRRSSIRKNASNQGACYELKYNTCFGTNVSYAWSTSELVNPNKTHNQLQSELSFWKGFNRSPKCWTVLQPLLCATFMPKCEGELIELPSQELCKVARSHCRSIVEQVMTAWPEFLKCDDISRFPPNCKNTEIRELEFKTVGECIDPLISVNDSSSYYEGFEGCGLKCQDPLFTNEEYTNMNRYILLGSLLLFAASTFIICTYCFDWKSSKGQPSEIIFYAILCFAVANFGWMLQIWPHAKTDIVCRRDGTMHRNELDQNILCHVNFFLVYFGSLSAMGWLAVFAYTWNLTCNAVGIIRARVENQGTYFHCLIWILSIFTTVLSFTMGKVDGNSMSGVCFVSYKNPIARIGLVIVPVLIAAVIIFFYLTKGLYRLHVVQKSSELIPASGRKHLRTAFRRALFFIVVAFIIILSFVATEVYQIVMWPLWNYSLREFLICKLKLVEHDVDECRIANRPSLGIVGLNIYLFFAGGLLVCSWACTGDTLDTWRRKYKSLLNRNSKPSEHRQRVQKHRLIAQAYEKKKRYNIPRNGSLSLTLQSIHGDPIGLNRLLDPTQLCQESNSRANQIEDGEEVSSDWVAAIPHLLERRNALTLPETSVSESGAPSIEMGRRPSYDSNSELDKPKKRYSLNRLKQKLESKSRFGRKGHRGSITSFESSELGSKKYQSSNSELDNAVPKSKSGLSKLKDKLGRRGGWRGRLGSMSSLDSNGTTAIVHPAATTSKKAAPRTRIVKDSAIQTSLEFLPTSQLPGSHRVMDKGMQTSLQSLNQKDSGTQTRKSATKKQKKRNQATEAQTADEEPEHAYANKASNHVNHVYNPILNLLTPQ